MKGAGILPITIYKGIVFFLLGRDKKNNYYCDFGGTQKIGESDFTNAIREGYEELNGILGSKKRLKNLVENNLLDVIEITNYTSYVFYLDYNIAENLPYYFNNCNEFIENNLVNKEYEIGEGLLEKSDIKLFRKKDLNPNIIRPFYKEVLDNIDESKYLN